MDLQLMTIEQRSMEIPGSCREENLCKSGQPLNTPLVDCERKLFR